MWPLAFYLFHSDSCMYYSYSRLEVLSTIKEIRGLLSIQGYPEASLPYLRNLRVLGSPDTPKSGLREIRQCMGNFSKFVISGAKEVACFCASS